MTAKRRSCIAKSGDSLSQAVYALVIHVNLFPVYTNVLTGTADDSRLSIRGPQHTVRSMLYILDHNGPTLGCSKITCDVEAEMHWRLHWRIKLNL